VVDQTDRRTGSLCYPLYRFLITVKSFDLSSSPDGMWSAWASKMISFHSFVGSLVSSSMIWSIYC
jgi:hypothetical protein